MFALPEMPKTPSQWFSAYASLAGTIMLIRSMADQLIPEQLRSYIYSIFHYLFTPLPSDLTLVIDEQCGDYIYIWESNGWNEPSYYKNPPRVGEPNLKRDQSNSEPLLLDSAAMSKFSLPKIPSTPSEFFSAYASLAGTMMLVRSVIDQFIPHQVRSYIYSYIYSLFQSYFSTPLPSNLTLVIDERCEHTRNQVYDAAQTYLRTKIDPSMDRLRIGKNPQQKNLTLTVEEGQQIVDFFDNIELKWTFVRTQPNKQSSEKRYFDLRFDKKFKDKVLDSYLPYVMARSKEIKEKDEKIVRIYTRDSVYDEGGGGYRGEWSSMKLEHPSTFDTLALDPEMKKMIIDDLDRFVKRKEFYKRVGKAWKRGYLLYGPPGTGKSSLIAAMANYLKFDIFDLELTSLDSNSRLRKLLVSTSNRSILVIEDIDCSGTMKVRKKRYSSTSEFTLSGLLNFIDGLWSSCGDERIIIFTTNHKDRLDPALLRPGRMDVHINMSYCSPHGFKILASNYLDIHGNHPLCGEIEGLIEKTEVTPAEVAEQLMRSDDPDIALGGLVTFLKGKRSKDEEASRIELEEATKEDSSKGAGGGGEPTSVAINS
ncbi:hypothetical protein L1049_023280 [Liquidambar formosana]|uniref:AAA+ ATPase domain-containing protein n=1 Tax=Liquidambar formosana TaxID=63359 RepID=A0AAP0RTM9_LIQFO